MNPSTQSNSTVAPSGNESVKGGNDVTSVVVGGAHCAVPLKRKFMLIGNKAIHSCQCL